HRLLDRFLDYPGALDRRATRAAGVLAPVPDGDPDLGPLSNVVRHPDRLHRNGVVRAFGILRAGHVWRSGCAVDGEAAQSVALDPLPPPWLPPGPRFFSPFLSTRWCVS